MQLSTILLWMISLTLVTTGVLARPQPPGLITLPAANDDQPASDASVCCRGPLILSCHPATVDPRVFSSRTDILLPGTDHVFNFMNAVQPNGQHYTSTEGDDATLTLNPQTGSMFGTMKSGDRAFSLEHCEDGYVWVEYDIQAIQEEEEGDMGENEVDAAQINDSSASQDTTTMEEFSVMIYYTPQFAAITPDIPGFVDQVLAETNQGYINSKVPMSIKLHCIEEATVNDISSSSATVNNFVAMKGSTAALRHSADTTVLLVASMGPSACGRAYGINKISSGETISACAKSCALGYFSFGHELAHSFGAYHNRETGHINPFYSYGQGHLIAKGKASTGYRSILAYNANGHSRRVNYYSNPLVIFPLTGTATGTADSNNAAVLTRNRMALKEVGDESETCKGTTPTPPSGDDAYCGRYRGHRHESIYLVRHRPAPKCQADNQLVFEPRFYLAKYVDLQCAYIKPGVDTYSMASNHWCRYGVREGRQGVASLNREAFDSDTNDTMEHFMGLGRNGSLHVSSVRASPSGDDAYCGRYRGHRHESIYLVRHRPAPKCQADKPLVFEPRFYLAKYVDLQCAYIKPGYDTYSMASDHWCRYGAREGRQGVGSFNSKQYLARYADLRRAFGSDTKRAAEHFIRFGFKEGRKGN